MSDRKARMEKKLPRQTGDGAIITGFVCSDWETKSKDLWPYNQCCQDPDNWEGHGDWRELHGEGDGYDPYYSKGFRRYRDVYCKVCGVHVIATEYSA
ncbi:MAG: hypothetical protein EHM35_21035 [Planctomycetaceae bacterium]|nr:MAG: hypothetical protein EHM35_21035 [Planctomycetaceae bacterium]